MLQRSLIFAYFLALANCVGYDASEAPCARLEFALAADFNTDTPIHLSIHDQFEQVIIDQIYLPDEFPLQLNLTKNKDFVALRVFFAQGGLSYKSVIPFLSKNDSKTLEISAKQTAIAQLVQQKMAGDQGSFSSMPQSAFEGLIQSIEESLNDSASSASIFLSVLEDRLNEAKGKNAAIFSALSASISQAYLDESKLDATKRDDYKKALDQSCDELRVPIVCDSTLIRVMFTVDMSGKSKDGNGNAQFIRQQSTSGNVFLAITTDDSSNVQDSTSTLKSTMVPNDATMRMRDDGTEGDEVAADGIYTRLIVLPRGIRVKYKYTNGSSGQGWTKTEEWPGNARILEVNDILSASGQPDCLVIRRDAFGDEATNKNHVNINHLIKAGGGNLSWEDDLGGLAAAKTNEGFYKGGLSLYQARDVAPLTPLGVAESFENGSCQRCPAPLTADPNDKTPPTIEKARFLSADRIEITFSESMNTNASLKEHYSIQASDQTPLAILAANLSGNRVYLDIAGPDFKKDYILEVSGLSDASVNQNALATQKVHIAPDYEPPKVLSIRSAPLKDLNPTAEVEDPTVGQVVVIEFSEHLDSTTASNIENYRIESYIGETLVIKAAIIKDKRFVYLVTDAQKKRRPYDLRVLGVKDLSFNPVASTSSMRFSGFSLVKMTFKAIPGFAWLDEHGSQKGLPSGEKLYLTGTVLAVARDLNGDSISIGGRTDVTGVPAFEMTQSDESHEGKAVYSISLLAPPGSYAWKVAHGVPGEYTNPPTTLVKVHKSLCTSNDRRGVNVDPVTLLALGGIDYSAATLSLTGKDKAGPFDAASGQKPKPSVVFKRENPDEICHASSVDVICDPIIIGTWRDIDFFKTSSNSTSDYDDGLPEIAPSKTGDDLSAPALISVTILSSYSVILSFDEAVDASQFAFDVVNTSTGKVFAMDIHRVGKIGDSDLLPSEIWLRTPNAPFELGANYQLSFNQIKDHSGNTQTLAQTLSFDAPNELISDTDEVAPNVLSLRATAKDRVAMIFSEAVDETSATNPANYEIKNADTGVALSIIAISFGADSSSVEIETAEQEKEANYQLMLRNIEDLANPPNAMSETTLSFKGFGDETPPSILVAQAISDHEIALRFSEALDLLSATSLSSYTINGLTIQTVDFGGTNDKKSAAFSPSSTVFSDDTVILTTSTMSDQSYALSTTVKDLSGNPSTASLDIQGRSTKKLVDVVLTYKISRTEKVAGVVPSRALSLSELNDQREGVFILGTVSNSGGTKSSELPDLTSQLGTFPPEGQPTAGLAQALLDDGQNGDIQAGDGVYSIRIENVPLGTYFLWKGFASFSVEYKNSHPSNLSAAFADDLAGPSIFSDGQEYPGNENGVRIVSDPDDDGAIYVNCLFGDEITYKKFTDSPIFKLAVGDTSWR